MSLLPLSRSLHIAKAIKNGKAGIIDFTGTLLVPFIYDDIEYQHIYYKTTRDNKVGMLSIHLSEFKKPVLKNILGAYPDFYLGAWFIEMPNGQKGYMDAKTGQIFIPGT